MIKRLTWFVGGAVTGVTATSYAKRKVRAAASQLAPDHVVRGAAQGVRDRAHDLADAVREGRSAMRSKERELRGRRDGTVVAEAHVGDGEPGSGDVEPARVIVLREAPAGEPRRRARR